MLVLSRHKDESIMIGDDIVITVVGIRGDKVRIGIEAPLSVAVHRREVYDAIMRNHGSINSHLKPAEGMEGIGVLPETPPDIANSIDRGPPLAGKVRKTN